MTTRWLTVALGAAVLIGPPAYAQQTNDPVEQAASQKLQIEAAQEPGGAADGFVAKMRKIADDTQILQRLNGDVDGWYPRLGGMTTGSGFAVGPGYRTHLFDDKILVDVSAAITMRNYKAADIKVEWLKSRFDRVELWTNYRYQDFPQEDFFGLGANSPLDARTNYALTSNDLSALGIYHIRPWLRAGADVGYFMPSIGRGTDNRFPSTDLVFDDAGAPGVAEQPGFLHSTLFAEVDYRDQRGNPTRGGFYRLAFATWDDRTLEQFDFHRFDGEASQFVPLGTRTHVFASRVGFAYVNNTTGERVPFYFLPYVGGSHTLRGYREFRFQDENALFLNSEYRWHATKWVGLALFFDAGEVRPDWEDIDLNDLRTSYGFGLRVNSDKTVFARLDFGFGGGEGRQIFFKLGPSF
jgi:outer membrane protein assembly factor BamA